MVKFKIQGGYNMNKTPDNTEQNIEENKKDENEIALITAKLNAS